MSEKSAETKTAVRDWLLAEWAESTARAVQSMADERPVIKFDTDELQDRSALSGEGLRLEIPLSIFPDPRLWIFLPSETVQDLGTRTLRAAGIDDAETDEIKNTCMEVMQQSSSGLGQAISVRIKDRVSSQLHEVETVPSGAASYAFVIEFPESSGLHGFLLATPGLLKALEEKSSPELSQARQPLSVEDQQTSQAGAHGSSKTFDLLLDVSMPVSVSFGRTEMLIKEVLKLTTGSIVELNRSVSEPVDIIVNDCIIARGEVVVVEGNYGVRIQHIASRQDRLRTSGQALASVGKPEAIAGLV